MGIPSRMCAESVLIDRTATLPGIRMPHRRWTFVCIGDHDNRTRQYSASSDAISYLASLGAGFVLIVTALSMIVALNGSARYDVLKLERQRSLLSEEIVEIQGRVAQIAGSIDGLIDKDGLGLDDRRRHDRNRPRSFGELPASGRDVPGAPHLSGGGGAGQPDV